MPRYLIRAALPGDEAALLGLAKHLNTVNLPHDQQHVEELLQVSQQSFSGKGLAPAHRKYVFLLWDNDKQQAAATSTLVAQLGRRDAPYIYLDTFTEEKYSKNLDKHFSHVALRLGFSYDGPTELAGLVVHPEYRGAPERLGLLISYIRFMFVAARRNLFREELLAELLPPLEPDGTSHLWEAVGRRFTDMSYADADILSSRDKTFIKDLFPSGIIYATLLSAEARGVIGKVGAQTRGVEKMLRRIGFYYADRVDPFDGGPHFLAPTSEVVPVRETRQLPLEVATDERKPAAGLVMKLDASPPYVSAAATDIQLTKERALTAATTLEALGMKPGDSAYCLSTDRRESRRPRSRNGR